MIIARRSFLASMLAAAAAPAIVRASSLMVLPSARIAVPSGLPIGLIWTKFAADPDPRAPRLRHVILGEGGCSIPCDGRPISRAAQPRLHAMLGGLYGRSGGDVLLPDLRPSVALYYGPLPHGIIQCDHSYGALK